MQYFLTGTTGFIGRHLMAELVKRGGTFHLLVRESSLPRLERLAREWAARDGQIKPVIGDIAQSNLGIEPGALDHLRGKIDHFFHLAAVYDMNVDDETAKRVNVEGTRHAIDVARALNVKCFHHVSSIAVAGRFKGNFLEAMFDEGQPLDHPYFETKFRSEQLVRHMADIPSRIYRPGIVVGHSHTGVMDKIDGPYYFFKLLQRIRDLLPSWVPLIGVEGGVIPMVPVDFVARAMDYLAHKPGQDGKTFHLVDPDARTVGDAINIICRAGHVPEFAMRLDLRYFRTLVPRPVLSAVSMVPAVRTLWNGMLEDLGIPPSVVTYITNPTTYDCREAQAMLAGSGITCPPLQDYAWRLWDYWERHLDPDVHRARNLDDYLAGKIVVITGASSGIGKEVAKQVASHGAYPLLIARSADRLAEVAQEIRDAGGDCMTYPLDLTDYDAADRVVERILQDHGYIDVLINNAGRSIRRSIELSYDRFHDFQRTMQLNYFGALRLILGFLPSMRARKSGHIVNISSIGVQAGAPRFSAYIASKAALDTFSRAMACEARADNVNVTTVYMPLVQTPMIAPTRIYEAMPTMSPTQAAGMVVNALLTKPKAVTTRLGTFAEILNALVPKFADRIQNMVVRIVPESPAARGEKTDEQPEVTVEAVVLANLLRGMHL